MCIRGGLLLVLVVLVTAEDHGGVCENSPCGVGECRVVSEDKWRCICPLGYKETTNGCEDVNECSLPRNPCGGKGSTCLNIPGSFSCSCAKVFYWDGYACVKKGRNKNCPDKGFPQFLVTPEPKVGIELGEELMLTCVGIGMPAPNVYWTKGADRRRMGPTATSSSLFYIANVTKKDIDVYECVLEDCCSGRIARAKVDISVPSQPCIDPKIKLFGMVWEYKTWGDALDFCVAKNLTMAVIRSEADRESMRKDAWRAYLYDPNGKKFSNEYWMWIGVNDFEEEGTFKTAQGESVEAVAKWLKGTPDNWDKLDENGQDVVSIHRFSSYWDDSYAFHLRPFACECPRVEDDTAEGAEV